MKKTAAISCLFLDIGGVPLTDGWNYPALEAAADKFDLDLKGMEDRHHLTFDTYEVCKQTLEKNLDRVIFYRKRPFTQTEFREFMFARSKPYPAMIELVCWLKAKYKLKIVVVSNEGRELNLHRIQKFKLDDFVDFFISSCFVHFRKPEADVYRLALDVEVHLPIRLVHLHRNGPALRTLGSGGGFCWPARGTQHLTAHIPHRIWSRVVTAQFPHNRTVPHRFFCVLLLKDARKPLQYKDMACITISRQPRTMATMSNEENDINLVRIQVGQPSNRLP
jgi:putative hydrolase of the HAD superfamily